MAIHKHVFRNRNLFVLCFVFIFVQISEKLFGSADVYSVSAEFHFSNSHILLVGAATLAVCVLAVLYPSCMVRFPKFFIPYLLLALYALLSTIWSPTPLKSGGLALLAFYNLLWGACIGGALRMLSEDRRFDAFISFWTVLVLADFTVETAAKGLFANLDEFSMIAFVLAFILMKSKRLTLAVVMLFVGISGQSVSAILGLIMFVSLSLLSRHRLIGFVFLILTSVLGEIIWQGVESGVISVYGKDAGLIMTGSGRFNAWRVVWEAIETAEWDRLLFGHGYGSDRQVLLANAFSWTVDVHNNLLYVCYGLGLLGVSFLFAAIVMSLRIPLIEEFGAYRIPLLAAFLFFGLSSSYFFGRPSTLAVFWLSYLTAAIRSSPSVGRRDPVTIGDNMSHLSMPLEGK